MGSPWIGNDADFNTVLKVTLGFDLGGDELEPSVRDAAW